MFDNLFTTYSNLDSPPIKRETLIDQQNIADLSFLYNPTQETEEDIKYDQPRDVFSFVDEPLEEIKQEIKQETPEVILKGSNDFERAFQEALAIDPNIAKYKNFLVKTAKRESGFNSYIQNIAGAPYYGYFQMGKNEIAMTTKMSVEQFRNNPVAQILGACKLYEMNLRAIKKIGVYNLGKQKGYSDDALVAGAWMGGPGGVKKYLLGKGDPSDSHWYGGKGGSSVGKIMNNWRNNE